MRFVFLAAALLLCVCTSPALASLPYYNRDMGYTIWLPNGWTEAPPSFLAEAQETCRPLPMHRAAATWNAGYVNPEDDRATSLLVEAKQCRKMRPADISNFNRFVVKELHRNSSLADPESLRRVTLKSARYFEEKKTLRVETEVVRGESVRHCLTYIVYTRKGMLTFVGYVAPDDDRAREAIDKSVLSLYLDDRLRY